MKIRRLHLNDFGVFRNETLEDIDSSLVVVAGPNRAGKSTFMTVLRYLGYGFPRKGRGLPFCVRQYEVEADVEANDGMLFNIRLQGHSKPVVSPVNHDREMTAEQLFGELDAFAYRQLFTISLDELRRLPEGVDKREQDNLQVILLGGGWSDALHLEKIRQQLDKEATDIGGKYGKIDVKQFKPYGQKLEEALAARDEANSQLETYYEKVAELQKLSGEVIPGFEEELEKLKGQLNRLALLTEYLEQYDRMVVLKQELEQPATAEMLHNPPAVTIDRVKSVQKEYETAVKDYQELEREFAGRTGGLKDNLKDGLLAAGDVLDAFAAKLSGWKVTLENLRLQKARHDNEGKELTRDLQRLNAEWKEGFAALAAVRVDKVSESRLQQYVEDYQETLQKYRQADRELAQTAGELRHKEQELAKQTRPDDGLQKRSLLLFAGSLLVLLAGVIVDLPAAIVAGILALVGTVVYFVTKNSRETEVRNVYHSLTGELQNLKTKHQTLQAAVSRLREEMTEQERMLDEIRQQLNLPVATPYRQLLDFYYKISELKKRYDRWVDSGRQLEEQETAYRQVLAEAAAQLQQLGLYHPESGDILVHAEKLFLAVEQALDYLQLARRLHEAERRKQDVEREIGKILARHWLDSGEPEDPALAADMLQRVMERLENYEQLKDRYDRYQNLYRALMTALDTTAGRRLFRAYKPETAAENWIIEAFGSLRETFASKKEVEKEYAAVEREMAELDRLLEEARAKKTTLENEVAELRSEKRIKQALQKIEEARKELEPLAEDYAVKRLAQLMVSQLQERLLQSTEGSLLHAASETFSRITGGEYRHVLPPEDLGSIDFSVQTGGSRQKLGVEALSRATKEQLFLAVRLSRIKEIDPPLPVVFDDSFVNFDPKHVAQVVEAVKKLSETHQVFVLTCHPQLLEAMQAGGISPQFWGLDRGRFHGPYADAAHVLPLLSI